MTQLATQSVSQWLDGATATSRVMTLALEGELDRAAVREVSDLLSRLRSDGVIEVVIDFSAVTHFDYRGVPALSQSAHACRELGGDLKLAGLSPYLYAIFRSAGAHDQFDYFAHRDAAVCAFGGDASLFG